MSQSLKKGIEALLFLASKKSVGVTELAERLGVNKSTAFRVLDTFLEADFVEKDKITLKYKLGPVILQLSERYYKNFNRINTAKPVMERLAAEIHESVHLCTLSNNSAVVIEQVLSSSRLVVNAKIGHREPLHCSSVGKCLLAFAAEKDREKMIAHIAYDVFTDKTIRDQAALLKELERVRAQGYAVDDGELNPDIRCVAVPLFDHQGHCVYSLGTSGAASRMTREKLSRVIPAMLRAAKEIDVLAGDLQAR